MEIINNKFYNWASIMDDNTRLQTEKIARLKDTSGNSLIAGHIALMPDAHVGSGATVGSVIPTKNVVIPSAVGVDLGCGMIAVKTNLSASQLPESLDGMMPSVIRVIPAGVGRGHDRTSPAAENWMKRNRPATSFSNDLDKMALEQFGTLGSGNHFYEVCLDENDTVWLVLHSGSRGIGNKLATAHIELLKKKFRTEGITLEDINLAYLVENTVEFNQYIADMLWAQDYALANREHMMNNALKVFFNYVGFGKEIQRINCHHNFTQKEMHNGEWLWITRKGAIKADHGDFGVIPGSMGARSYIVEGLGNSLSYNSCSHGAGRTMSRSEAKKKVSVEELNTAMVGKTWNSDMATALLDEAPQAYKPIDVIMEDQKDLVSIVHELRQVFNFKGVK